MHKKLASLLVGVVAAGAALLAVQPAAAAPVPTLASLSPATVTSFNDMNYVGFLAQWTVTQDCDNLGYHWTWGSTNSLWWMGHSSVKYNIGNSGFHRCNRIAVRAIETGQWSPRCINGIGTANEGIWWYGAPWNDKVSGYALNYDPSCPLNY